MNDEIPQPSQQPRPPQDLNYAIGLLVGTVDSLTKAVGKQEESLHAAIKRCEEQSATYLARLEKMENRMYTLESNLVTREDFRDLSETVQKLSESSARREGGTKFLGVLSSQAATWLAVIISGAALLTSLTSRQAPAPRELPEQLEQIGQQ
jgi:hypothetical protein